PPTARKRARPVSSLAGARRIRAKWARTRRTNGSNRRWSPPWHESTAGSGPAFFLPVMQGHFALLLHAHLPFVRHPEHEKFLDEICIYTATTETYLPLIQIMEGWQNDGM